MRMQLIQNLTDKQGHQLINVPAEPKILMEMGFTFEEAVVLCANTDQASLSKTENTKKITTKLRQYLKAPG